MTVIFTKLFRDKVFIRYVLSGAIVSVLELAAFALMIYLWHWAYLWASSLIFFFGLILSFILRKIWVFSSHNFHHSHKKQVLFYTLVFLASTLVNLGIMYVLVENLQLSKFLSQIMAMTIVGFFTFTANKTITFKPLPTRQLSLVKYIESNEGKFVK